MKKIFLILFISLLYCTNAFSQCAVCKATVASTNDKAANGLNGGIFYLAAMPFMFIAVIGYKWWKENKKS